ncbi:tetratricopeptide repeat protein [Phocaeicola barnesiae]|jgi:Flp pilus assembly protein TadD/outer membrane protein OmpA-like peptidoglycan-associated protein|uniref:Tetratricopeptide repeat protein n=2 Tax=Phocaeicola TaxID=909656 RepID=A0AAW5N1B3_9BACT|nr:tetratricopeptide repeat protein [Phocaeicola barnesiae]MCF2597785.1 tetratricopeptide repeat protein [Phocaeicola barnesiae]MCR8874596.1 tetratricopeptide repeat protein [Phocaeicola barnesiae]MDM8232095.1 tetratricopeptide repeat protein [Phocaeicola barnesiae]MDM8241807.1 tetratricopeptide repeat protein [Phocaeicola barnesiae]MDM8308466.1 tetratricopeptide repeat protein [Phocaeicola barnesiae]
MIKKLYLPLVALLVLALSSCGKMGELSADYFTTNPEVLEAVGGKVPVTITGKFPEKYFKKNAIVEVTPVLRWNGGEAKGQSATFQGEKVEGNDQTISYKAGGTYTMKASFDYVPEMAKSELYLDFKIKRGKKEYTIPSVKIADGVIATSELPTVGSANAAYAADAFQRIIKQAQQANIMFLIQQANLRASELKSDSLKAFNKKVVEVAGDTKNYKLNNIEISAYASPDGGVELNTGLAEKRQDNTETYLNKELKKGKIETQVDTKYTAQDWEGFQELVSKSNIQDKDLILRVLSMYQDPEQRETEIKNISSVYKTLADEILPQLRRARLTANYDIIGRSDEEINEAFDTDAKVLSVEELLYAATLTNDNARKEAIYKKTVELYPSDCRAYNNLGMMAYAAGDKAAAENYFKQALSKNASSAEANTNMGLCELVKGNVANAETYLSKSTGANTANEALGNLYIKQGQYDRAVNAFGDTKTNSAALAQILAKDYNKAKNTLNAVKNPDAYTDYLMAIVGARTNNADLVKSSMAKVAQKDASLAAKAQDDREFAKYANEIK